MTDEELLILNCIIYDPNISGNGKPRSVLDWANDLDISGWDAGAPGWDGNPGGMTVEEIQGIVATVKAHPDVYGQMNIVDVTERPVTVVPGMPPQNAVPHMMTIEYDKPGGGAVDEVAIVYQGTTGDMDWVESDAGLSGEPITPVPAHRYALDYFDRMHEYYSQSNPDVPIVTSGHSLGGNCAQYVEIMRPDEVARAYSFDGPGFSAAFIAAHLGVIDKLRDQDRLVTHADAADPVHALLNAVGREVFHEAPDGYAFFEHHSPAAMLEVVGGLATIRPEGKETLPPAWAALEPLFKAPPPGLAYLGLWIWKGVIPTWKYWGGRAWDAVQSVGAHLVDFAKSGLEKLRGWISSAVESIENGIHGFGEWLKSAAESVKSFLTDALMMTKDFLKETLSAAERAIMGLATRVVSVIEEAQHVADEAWRRFAKGVGALWDALFGGGSRKGTIHKGGGSSGAAAGFLGMDVETVGRLAEQLRREAANMGQIRTNIDRLIEEAGRVWQGPDAGQFRAEWSSHSPKVGQSAERLREMSRSLDVQVRQQVDASRT